MATPRLKFPGAEIGTSDKSLALNENVERIEGMLGGWARQRGVTAPPGTVAEGDVHIIGSGATGLFAGQPDGTIAHFLAGAWVFYAPAKGLAFHVEAEGYARIVWNGSAWTAPGGAGLNAVQGDVDPGLGGNLRGNNRRITNWRPDGFGFDDATTAANLFAGLQSARVAKYTGVARTILLPLDRQVDTFWNFLVLSDDGALTFGAEDPAKVTVIGKYGTVARGAGTWVTAYLALRSDDANGAPLSVTWVLLADLAT